MKQFLKLLDEMWPTSYPEKRKKKITDNFSQNELMKIENFLSWIKKQAFEESEEEHIKG